MTAVCIATYNHERFIAQCLDSVLMQQCDEPLRIYIGDDASTDGTEAICRQYAGRDKRVIYLRRERNMGLTDNTLDMYRRIMADGCDYIAMLDGDDYWLTPDKLQRQIDYLRAHPECGFVHTNGKVLSGAGTWTFGQREGVYGLQSVGFANCTVLFRAALLSDELIEKIQAQHFLWLDYPLYGVFYQHTQWAYLPECTAAWRDHESVSQPRKAADVLRLKEERVRMWKWLNSLFPGQVGYSQEEADDYLYTERLNAIYTFGDKRLITPALLQDYHPKTVSLWLKLLGLKFAPLFDGLRFISHCKAQNKKKQ